MYHHKLLIVALLAICALTPFTPQIVSAAQPSVESLYQDARKGYYSLLSSPEKMRQRASWERVIKKFKVVVDTRPKTNRGRDALYTMGLLYKKLASWSNRDSDREMAVHAFKGVISRFPKSSLVDDAQGHIGDIHFSQRKYKKAKTAYSKTKAKQKLAGAKEGRSSRLTEVRRFNRDGYTRIVLGLSSKTAFIDHVIRKPDRVFVDLLDTRIGANLAKVTHLDKGPVKSIRMAHNQTSVTRVVFDLKEPGLTSNVSALTNPFRIVIDVGRKKVAAKRPIKKKRVAKSKSVVTPKTRSKNSRKSSRPLIVIDAGHGGKDPGAIGPSGLREKHVTLRLAKELKKELTRSGKYRVALTRDRDRFLELDERTVMANSLHADLFVSVHINASKNRSAHGLETYFLSPARSKDELETAARENMIATRSSNEMENDLAYIMADLNNTRKVNDSYALARNVQTSMVKGVRRSYGGVSDKGVKQAMFHVLWRASMPSVLVEAGFISNRKEERRLKDPRYIRALARSIAKGIDRHSKTSVVARR